MNKIATLLLFLSLSFQSFSKGSYELQLKSGKFTPTENFESEYLQKQNSKEGTYIVQFYSIPDQGKKNFIASKGVVLGDYLPKNAFVTRVPSSFDFSELQDLGVRSIQPYSPVFRSPANYLGDVPNYCNEGGNKVRLYTVLFSWADKHSYYQRIASLGGKVNEDRSFGEVIEVVIPQKRRSDLRKYADLMWVEFGESEPVPDDLQGQTLHRVSNLQNGISGRDYDGTGVNVSLIDDAPIAAHIDLQGRITQIPPIGGNGSHGDGTVGIVMGAGNLDPVRGLGMAPGVTMRYYDYVNQSNYPHINAAVTNYNTFGTIATSSSYSEFSGFGGVYTSTANFVDNQVKNNPPIQHVFSAGNSSASTSPTYTVGSPWATITGGRKAAKSTIAVAALDYEDNLAGYSSRGPAEDGRVKPDISSYGDGHISLDNAANTYQSFGGTSAACPGITGIVAVMYQAYRENNGGQDPHSGLIKAMLLNSADDLGNPGPDFFYGWGRVNALRAVRILENNQYLTDTIAQGDTNTHSINIPSGVAEFKVMVYWNDHPGSVTASQALVNDLNIELEDGSSALNLPFVLDHRDILSSLQSNAVPGVDSVNNMEQVLLTNPSAGNYTLRIKGDVVPQGPQEYYVVYEYRYPKPEVTYPTGGETFVPGEVESIRWNSSSNSNNYDLFYSLDGGNSWNPIVTGLSGILRSYDWSIPSGIKGQALVRISDQVSGDTSDFPFSIFDVPDNFEVGWRCSDSALIRWDTVPGASSYRVYRLGMNYMDSFGTVTENYFIDHNTNSTSIHWYSVSAFGNNGEIGRRAVAILKSVGTGNCPVPNDASVSAVLNPAEGAFASCQQFDSVAVEIEIENTGTSELSNIPVAFTLNGDPPVLDTFPGPIGRYQKARFTFQTTVDLNGPVRDTISAWTNLNMDAQPGNDQVDAYYEFFPSNLVNLPWNETFDQMSTCSTTPNCAQVCNIPNGWNNTQNGLGDDIDFIVDNNGTASGGTGPFGDTSSVSGNGNYVYLEATGPCINLEAVLLSPCIDLRFATSPELKFFYHMRGGDMGDLRLNIISGAEVFENVVGPISGDQGVFWKGAVVDLTPYVGKIINLQFVGTTGTGFESDIAIDDVSIIETATFSQDAGMTQLTSPNYNSIEDCLIQDSVTVSAVITNLGAFSIANFNSYYQLDNGPIQIEPYNGVLVPSASDTITFNARFAYSGIGSYDLKVWHDYSLDLNPGNDTIFQSVSVVASTVVSAPTSENFGSFTNCPTTFNCGATICNLGNGYTNLQNGFQDDIDWRTNQGSTPSNNTGPSGDHTSGTGRYLYLEASNGCFGQTAILESPCIDLTGILDPELDFWYHMDGADMGDLHVDIFAGGNWIEDFVAPISGDQGSSWQNWSIDLSLFSGATIRFRIRGVTGPDFASDMAIDDILVYSAAVAPTASFSIPSSTCKNDQVTISDQSIGSSLSYDWDFGGNALPATANTVGPHNVIFTSGGFQVVRLVASNSLGVDTFEQVIYVDSLPTSDFQFQSFGDSVIFTNTSLNFDNQVWRFGDGDSATTINTSHVYNTPGVYLAELEVDNVCGMDLFSTTILISNLSWSNGEVTKLRAFPNPVNDQLTVTWKGSIESSGIVRVLDVSGKELISKELRSLSGNNEVHLDFNELPGGSYLVKMELNGESAVFKVEKN